MAHIPVVGRLRVWEYVMLLASLILILLEGVIRIITLALPRPILELLYNGSRNAFNYLSSKQGRKAREKKRTVSKAIAKAADFVELCDFFGYYAEEHIVQTKDGYLLGVHRLGWRRGEEDTRINAGKNSLQKKVVYLHHGLMMSSEVWCCLTEREKALPFVLVEKGYDVWLGNNRGNKYSKKSTKYAPTDPAFWAFSIDQFAFHDIPDTIDYILSTTQQPSLTYIGFSQGTAQAFATLSIHPTLNDRVDCFIALAPAMSPPGLRKGIVDTFVKASPDVLFLAFGRRAMLTSATMWQAILYPPIFIRIMDMSLRFLFGWKTLNISAHQKLAAYPHLYSFTSTKSVVHWFQIIRNGTFQMYDDDLQAPFSLSDAARYYKVAKFPTKNIKTPIVMVYGGSDSLVDINIMLKELPKHTVVKEVPHYEHLDFLWADDVVTQVFPHVFEALEKHAKGGNGPNSQRRISPRRALTFAKSVSQLSPTSDEDGGLGSPDDALPRKHSDIRSSSRDRQHSRSMIVNSDLDPTQPTFKPRSSPHRASQRVRTSSPTGSASHMTEQTSTSRPEGWWSSDEVGGPTEPSTPRSSTGQTMALSSKTDPGARAPSPSPAEETPNEVPALANKKVRRTASKASIEEKAIRLPALKAIGGEVSRVSSPVDEPMKRRKKRRTKEVEG